jgi:hypothetical protein
MQYHENLLLRSPNSKKMKNSLIYNMEMTESSYSKKKTINSSFGKSVTQIEVKRVGHVPQPRDGHSVNLFEDKMLIFGGDRNKFPFNDLYTFNLF